MTSACLFGPILVTAASLPSVEDRVCRRTARYRLPLTPLDCHVPHDCVLRAYSFFVVCKFLSRFADLNWSPKLRTCSRRHARYENESVEMDLFQVFDVVSKCDCRRCECRDSFRNPKPRSAIRRVK